MVFAVVRCAPRQSSKRPKWTPGGRGGVVAALRHNTGLLVASARKEVPLIVGSSEERGVRDV